jgi:hypothetical protein
MNNEDSTWSDFISSCSDDGDEDYVDSRNAGKSRTKRVNRQSPRLGSSSSENKNNPLPSRRSQKEAMKSPTSTATVAISRNSPLASRSRSIRKRRLPRPSNGCGNLSDTSNSSDDSLLFRSSHSLTGTMKNTKKKTTIDKSTSNNYSAKKGVNSYEDEKSCSSPGIKSHRFDVGKYNGKNAVIDNIQFDEETNASGNSSDSDDTAELMRQLTRKPSPSNKFAAGSSFPSRQLPGCSSSSSSPKPKVLSSRNHNDDTTKESRLTDEISHQDNTNVDDEGSLNGDYDCNDDDMDELTTRQQTRLASISGTKPPPQSLSKGVCANTDTIPSSYFQNDNAPNESPHDATRNSPVRFELPTQSSSSEESSASGEEEEASDNDVEERENRNIIKNNCNNNSDNWHSFGEGVIAKEGENDNDVHREKKQQEMIPYQDIHRRRQGHETEKVSTQTDRELFEAAFDDNNTIHARNTAGGRSEDCGLHHTSPQRQDSIARRRYDGVTRTDEEYFGGTLLEEVHQDQPISTLQHHHRRHHPHLQQQQPCIDLVDSDDSEQEKQTPNAREHQNRHQEHRHRSTAQIFENEESPRSPTRRRSPRFNVAGRNFFYNKPWTNSNHLDRQGEEDDDVVQFEDDDSKVPARSSRRVTQDHNNHIIHHNDNSGGSNIYEESSVSNNLQQRLSSNPPGHQELPPEHQQHQRHIPRPWPSGALQTTRRMRDPTASNVSLAASVVVKNPYSGGRKTSEMTTPSTTDSSRNQPSQRSIQQHRRNDTSIGDIRTFVSRRPILANETRNRARSIEAVRANRHDIQGHVNVTVVNHAPPPPVATRRRSQPQRRAGGEEEEDVIEVFDDEVEALPLAQPARSRRAPAAKAVAKAKPKRKRASTRKTKSRKTGGRKRTRKSASSRGKGRGGGRFGKRGGNITIGNNDDSGAWGPAGAGGWASARPVHREDPAFQNVGAEITF